MKTRKSISLLFAGMLLLALVVTGYQSSTDKNALQDGSYRRELFTLVLKEGRFYFSRSVSAESAPLEEGSYMIERDKITFKTDKFAPHAKLYCGKFPTYTYLWAFDPETEKLTFTTVDDPCAPRRGDFTRESLTYSK